MVLQAERSRVEHNHAGGTFDGGERYGGMLLIDSLESFSHRIFTLSRQPSLTHAHVNRRAEWEDCGAGGRSLGQFDIRPSHSFKASLVACSALDSRKADPRPIP